jgi:nucleoside-diphosphate-sugar epimerase
MTPIHDAIAGRRAPQCGDESSDFERYRITFKAQPRRTATIREHAAMTTKTLVTGGTGFTGSHLVRRLLHDGHQVHCVDYARGLFYDELEALGAQMTLGDISDRAFCEKVIGDAQVVYHLAAAFRQLDVPNQYYWDVNVEGTRYLCEAAQRAGVRKFVYCSTQGVHGDIANPPGDENSPIAPADYYQYTKYEGEKVVNAIVQATGFDATTVRPTAIYGPGDPARFLIMYNRSKRGKFMMFGSGKTFYHPVYIDNLVDCFLLAAEKGRKGEAYIAADEHYYSLEDLIRHVGRSMGVDVKIKHYPFWPLYWAAVLCELVCKPLRIAPPIFRRRVDWFRQVRAFRIDKAKRELGYEPRIGIEEGLARTARWYIDHGYLEVNHEQPREQLDESEAAQSGTR